MKKIICTIMLVLAALTGRAQALDENGAGRLSDTRENDGRRYAVVDLSSNFMREEPAYEAEMGNQALMGTVVETVGEQGYWRQIITPEPYKAWVNEMGLVEMDSSQIEEYIRSPKYICIAEHTHIYTAPDITSFRISDFLMGGLVRQSLSGKGAPVRSGKFLKVTLPSGVSGWVLRDDVMDFSSCMSRKSTASEICGTALHFLGVPYMWGGTTVEHMDCSGLARFVFYMHGILLPRNASQQARVGEDVSLGALKKGDLLFFGQEAAAESPERVTHVAIYLGEGLYIHSSQKVRLSSLDSSSSIYGGRMPIRARRILGHVDDGTGIISVAKSPYYFIQSE